MKYGVIYEDYGVAAVKMGGFNIGDPIQHTAVELLYQYIGIPKKEIVYIPFDRIRDYSGEYVLLPLCGVAVGLNFGKLPFSPKIVPVFISTHIAVTELSPEDVLYLRTYEPIGCRDELTLTTMRKYHIQAYLSGCITTIFPRREKETLARKVLLIDTPAALEPFLPDDVRANAERLTHLLPIPPKAMTPEEADILIQTSKERLAYYRDNAALVISSRLHALVPCMAMGIPVIGAFENISYRFSWLDKFIRLYSMDDFSEINWTPAPIDYEDKKRQLVELFSRQIRLSYEKFGLLCNVSDFYENRERANYGSHYIRRIREMHGYMPDGFSYLIWGCGLIGMTVMQIMAQEFPKAKLVAAVDNFVAGMWYGVPIIKPSLLENYQDSFIILATYSGRFECMSRMDQLGRVENKDFIYIATQNG